MKNKRYFRIILLLMFIWCGAAGCAALEPDFSIPEDDVMEMGEIDFDVKDYIKEEDTEKQDANEDADKDNIEEPSDNEGEKEKTSSNTNKFYYNQLNEDEKIIYTSLLEGFKNYEDTIQVHVENTSIVENIFYSVMNDNPDIYWVKNYQGVFYRNEEGRYDIKPNYFYGKNKCEEIDKIIEEVKKEFLANAYGKQTDYEKIKYVFEFLSENVKYGGDLSLCQNIDSAFVQKETVCAGYAKATQYLLESVGVECIYVTGVATNSEGKTEDHAWNIVKCDGDYCYVDTTWGDQTDQNGVELEGTDNINYDYLCCSEATLSKSHVIEGDYDYPDCSTEKWNYYILNNMYYKEFNTQEIVENMKKDIGNKENLSVFKFENQSDYQQLVRILTNSIFKELGDELGEDQQKLEGIEYQTNDRNFVCKIYWKYKK